MIKSFLIGQNKIMEVVFVFENIFETVIRGSSTEFLNIPEDDYFLSYEKISKDAAQEITDLYFKMKGKDGVPTVKEITYDPSVKLVQITLEIAEHRDFKLEPYTVPHILNATK
jgi:hypothetical protein